MPCKKIVFVVSLLIVLGCLFNFSHTTVKAMTTDEMIVLIQKLQQQIADLQKQLAQARGTQTVWCHDFYKNLSAGSSNEEVASLHTVLEKEGFDIFDEEKANREFGESTASAISGFQQKYASEILMPLGLRYGTGILGKSTRTKLNKLFGCNVKAAPRPFCSPISATCEAGTAKIVCPAGLDDKGCPFPCKCAPVACTQEAKVCPDGTSVSRIAPACEFAPCPNQITNQAPVIYGIGGPTFLKVHETGTWTVKASDQEQGTLVFSVLWGDGSELQSQKSTTNAEVAIFTHSFSKAGAYNLTFSVSDGQNLAAKMGVTVKVEQTISPLVVSEQVKCLFKGSLTEQKCIAASEGYFGYACNGREGCVVDIRGKQGDKVTWKSSCGGYAYTTIDGQNEYAEFDCGAASISLYITSPNGREVWELSKASLIRWNQTQSGNISVTVRNKQLPGTGSDPWFNMVINGSVAGIVGENRTWWDIPNYLNPHTGYEICVAGSFIDRTGQVITLEDCSDAPFAIHEVAVGTTAKTCAEMSSNQWYYFDVCNKGGFDNVCFNKFSGIYQGCTRNIRNDCTEQNANAQVNMLCPVSTTAVPVPTTPTTVAPAPKPTPTVPQPTATSPVTTTPLPVTSCATLLCGEGYVVYDAGGKDREGCPIRACMPATPTETGIGFHSFEILDAAASCSCQVGAVCAPCPPASTYTLYTAKISVYNEKGVFLSTKDTSSGRAVFDNLPYGIYVAYIAADGYQSDKTSFTVGANYGTGTSLLLKKIAAQTTTQTANKSITVLSPNGGERLLKGVTYAIKWNSSNVASVYIKLRKGSDTYNGLEGEVSKVITNSGIFFWTVPTTLPDGSDYAIRVVDSTATALDDSDSLFSIVSSAASNTQETVARTCPELYTLQRYYFDICQKQDYANVCFNKFTILYQGCGKITYNDCTQNNANAERNILCSVTGGEAVLATPVPTTPTPSVTTSPTPIVKDTTPPSIPFNLTATALSSTPPAVGLSWGESKDDVKVVGYALYRDGTLISPDITTGSYRDTNVSSGATYSYTVAAFDAVGNYSAKVPPVSITIPAETTPPVISSISANEITANSAVITWTTDEAADSTVEYGLTASADTASGYNNAYGANIFLTSHQMRLGSLQPNTLYHYQVRSKDSWGNSAVSGDNTFTTAAAPVYEVQVISIDGAQVTAGQTFYITWQHASEFSGKTIIVDISVLSADSTSAYTVPKLDIVKNYTAKVSSAVPSKEEYGWQVPSDLTPGDYKVKICEYEAANPSSAKCDETDKTFKVIASAASQAQSLDTLANILEAAKATVERISQGINELLKNR